MDSIPKKLPKITFSGLNSFIRRNFFSRIFIDKGCLEDSIIIAGSGRGGTTWLANLISQVFSYRLIFEPSWHLHIGLEGTKDFFHHRYIAFEEKKYNDQLKYILGGKYRNIHTNNNKRIGPYNGRVIKEICSNLYLQKFKEIAPRIPIIFIVRHPCAVVHSRLEQENWGIHSHLFNEQEEYIKQYFDGKKHFPSNILEDHIITYCHENYFPLKILMKKKIIYVAYFENILLNFDKQFNEILEYIKQVWNKGYLPIDFRKIDENNPISVKRGNFRRIKSNKIKYIARWKTELKEAEIDNIISYIDKFDLNFILDEIKI